jgi:hypothetical protein
LVDGPALTLGSPLVRFVRWAASECGQRTKRISGLGRACHVRLPLLDVGCARSANGGPGLAGRLGWGRYLELLGMDATREFITALGGAAVWPLMAGAQQTKVWRVGYLSSAFTPLKSFGDAVILEAFHQQMNDLGYVEGKNLIIEARYAEGQFDRLPAFATELVPLRCDVIVAVATPAIAAAQRATSTIPIVMSPSTDPIGSGFVKSFARPGGNITGVANLYGDMTAKSVELLHTILPDAKKIAVLMSSNPTHPPLYEVARAAAQSLGLSTIPIVAPTPADRDRVSTHCKRELRCIIRACRSGNHRHPSSRGQIQNSLYLSDQFSRRCGRAGELRRKPTGYVEQGASKCGQNIQRR